MAEEPKEEAPKEEEPAVVKEEAAKEETKNVETEASEATKKEEVAISGVEDKTESIYDTELPNRIIVGRNHPLSFYVDRARRVFRMETEVFIQGRGDNIATTCKLVEALKRQKIAVITKISTGMNVEPYFNSYGDAKWGQPTAIILFTLKRGLFAEFIADYQQRKIIEIFENTTKTGKLTREQVEGLKFAEKFKAKEQQIEAAKASLDKELQEETNTDKTINLPAFIRYASKLIDPLLKPRVFKDILAKEFGIEVSGGNQKTNQNIDD